MNKIFVSFFVVCTMFSTIVYAGNLVKKVYFSPHPIVIDGEQYSSEMPVLQYQERTYVALREFSEMVDVFVDFKDGTMIIETEKELKNNFEKIEEEVKKENSKEEILETENSKSENSSSNSKIVYISKTGKKYHKLSNCNSANYYEITLSDAINQGYTPCLRCANAN